MASPKRAKKAKAKRVQFDESERPADGDNALNAYGMPLVEREPHAQGRLDDHGAADLSGCTVLLVSAPTALSTADLQSLDIRYSSKEKKRTKAGETASGVGVQFDWSQCAAEDGGGGRWRMMRCDRHADSSLLAPAERVAGVLRLAVAESARIGDTGGDAAVTYADIRPAVPQWPAQCYQRYTPYGCGDGATGGAKTERGDDDGVPRERKRQRLHDDSPAEQVAVIVGERTKRRRKRAVKDEVPSER